MPNKITLKFFLWLLIIISTFSLVSATYIQNFTGIDGTQINGYKGWVATTAEPTIEGNRARVQTLNTGNPAFSYINFNGMMHSWLLTF